MNKNNIKTKIKISIFRLLETRKVKTILLIVFFSLAIICFSVSRFIFSVVEEVDNIDYINTSDQTIIGEFNEDTNIKTAYKICSLYKDCTYNMFSHNATSNCSKDSYIFYAVLVGSLNISEKMVMPSIDNSGATEYTRLIDGRLPNENDKLINNHVVLIYESVAKIFFGDENPINKSIIFNNKEYNIIGILEDSPDIKRVINMIKSKDLSDKSYFTLPFITNEINEESIEKILMFFDGPISTSTLKTIRKEVTDSGVYSAYLTTLNAELEAQEMFNTNHTTIKIIINIITVVLCCSVLIFVYLIIKERNNEIAVRMAVGASRIEIVSMIVLEMFVCCIISILYSVPLSVLIMNLISKYVKNITYCWIFPLNIKILLLPGLLLMLLIIVFSIIITSINSRKKIINSLRD